MLKICDHSLLYLGTTAGSDTAVRSVVIGQDVLVKYWFEFAEDMGQEKPGTRQTCFSCAEVEYSFMAGCV